MRASSADAALRQIVDDYRTQCLWFLRPDYYPESVGERQQVLSAIARYGNVEAFRRVAELRAWDSHPSSDRSAGF